MKFLLTFIILFFTSLLNGFDFIPIKNDKEYIICKRPLSFLPINIDIERDEILNANLQHFQFFESNNRKKSPSNSTNLYTYVTPKQGLFDTEIELALNSLFIMKHIENGFIEVDKECQEKHFPNFGYFNHNNVKCNEQIEDFPYCSATSYDKETLLKVLDEILGDSQYKQYNLIKYNCQTFTKNLIEAYGYKTDGIGLKGEACYVCNNCTNKYQALPNEEMLSLIKLQWEKNPFYIKKFFLRSFRFQK